MAGWTEHTGQAVLLALENVDTDQLIPARFMSVPRSEGYGDYLLHDMRRGADGALAHEFGLNAHPGASVLVAGRNFGTGSSREAAVYALVDAGIRVVVAPSFGDIFASNAVNNGLLPAQVSAADAEALHLALGAGPVDAMVSLETKVIALGEVHVPFELDDTWRTKLQNGWDDIDLTLQHDSKINAYRQARQDAQPWTWPKGAV